MKRPACEVVSGLPLDGCPPVRPAFWACVAHFNLSTHNSCRDASIFAPMVGLPLGGDGDFDDDQ